MQRDAVDELRKRLPRPEARCRKFTPEQIAVGKRFGEGDHRLHGASSCLYLRCTYSPSVSTWRGTRSRPSRELRRTVVEANWHSSPILISPPSHICASSCSDSTVIAAKRRSRPS